MTTDALLALPAIALIAAATPRQAEALFGAGFGRAPRKAVRLAGFVLLAFSLGAALKEGDRARTIVGWIGLVGLEAMLVALACTVLSRKVPRGAARSPVRHR